MVDENPAVMFEKEVYVKKIKRGLDNWREVTLVTNSVLLWNKSYYPWLMSAFVTFLFLELAYYDPSVLTAVSLTFLCLTLLDYFGPIISSTIWKQEHWTAGKEREFEDICRSLASFLVSAKLTWSHIMEIKTSRPNLYYTMAVLSLGSLAWIGNTINNFVITYLLVMAVLFLPGLIHKQYIQKVHQIMLLFLAQLLRGNAGDKVKRH